MSYTRGKGNPAPNGMDKAEKKSGELNDRANIAGSNYKSSISIARSPYYVFKPKFPTRIDRG
jgi:hypothetical protein